MRYLVAASLATAAVASGLGSTSDNWRDYVWSYTPEKTAAWYEDRGRPLPDFAGPITTSAANKSYIVKLECLGCPFRVREYGEFVETWQNPPQDNSLLLNFTVDDSQPRLLLNGDAIERLGSRPPAVCSYQVPANLSANIMDKIESMKMLDLSWKVGTMFGSFELEYEHTLLGTEQAGMEWVQFDVTAVIKRQDHNPGAANLDHEGQKMIQILLAKEVMHNKLSMVIKDIQLVERQDRQMPLKMKCGKDAMIKTDFSPLEWDHYGKFGTLSRTMNMILGETGDWFDRNGLYIIIVSVLAAAVGLYRFIVRKRAARAAALAEDDAEAALLVPECDHEPPVYADEPLVEEQKEQAVEEPVDTKEEQ